MSRVSQEKIKEAKRLDLLTYLQNYEPQELVHYCWDTYCTRTHDSLKISNGKWMWWSRGIGGKTALDYLIKVRGMSFVQAVNTITKKCSARAPKYKKATQSYEQRPLLLPKKSLSSKVVTNYLLRRGIDYEIIKYCLDNKLIFESLPYHNAVFVGYNENKEPKYAAYHATNNKRIMGDCSGSKKQYSFRLSAENTGEVHLFECAIDLLSYATLIKSEGKDWRRFNLVSLSGVYSPSQNIGDSKVPVTLTKLLEKDKSIKRIILHLDNDAAGRKASKALQIILSDKYEVVDDPPKCGKDVNDFLCIKLGIKNKKEGVLTLENKIKVLLVEPGKYPKRIEIDETLAAMQRTVGGYIEEYMPFEDDDVALVCNDEGKLNKEALNRAVYGKDGEILDVIAGKFFITYAPVDSENFQSMPEDLMKKYEGKFKYPEHFYMSDKGIEAKPYKPVAKDIER